MTTTSSILGQYETTLSQQAGTTSVASDKDTFLKLLVAQLTNQDPLNPVEDTEFITQLAQFTSVEELQKLNTGMEQLNASYLNSQITSAASLIGLEVIAGGTNISLKGASSFKSEEDYPTIIATPAYDMTSCILTVYSTNADGSVGSIVYSAEMTGSWSAGGLHSIAWPGTNSAGTAMPDGSYTVSIRGYDANGAEVAVDLSSNGVVIGVETSSDGNHKLYLNDGRTVNFNEIALITVPLQSSSSSTDSSDSGSDDTSGNTDDESTDTGSEEAEG